MTFALPLLLLLPGCLGSKPTPLDEESLGVGPSLGMPALRWEECHGVVGAFEARRDDVRELIPSSFELRGLTTASASLVFESFSCERAATNESVYSDARFFHLLARVRPVNESWVSDGPSYYSVAILAAASGVVGALKSIGLPAVMGAPTSSSLARLPNGLEALSVKWESPDLGVSFEYLAQGGSVGAAQDTVHYWATIDGVLRRIDNQKAYAFDGPALFPGILRASGDSPAAGTLPLVCCAAWTGQGYAAGSEVWTLNPNGFS